MMTYPGAESKLAVALIVGSSGQDGYYLAERLRARGDEVVGLARTQCRSEREDFGVVDIRLRDPVARLVARVRPDEIYFLAAEHGAAESVATDAKAASQRAHDVHVTALCNFLDAMEAERPAARLFYASSCRVFGEPAASPQDERTPIAPRDAYGLTKAAGMALCREYRARGAYCCAGILYNHESPRRRMPFVSRKIVQAAVDIRLGSRRELVLGDLAAQVDWGAAEDYVEAMTRMLQLGEPSDLVIASGELHTVQEFAAAAFDCVGLPWQVHVTEEPTLVSRRRTAPLCGDSTRLRQATGWRPSIAFGTMVERMVQAELAARRAG